MDEPLAVTPAGSRTALALPFRSLGLRVSRSTCHRAGLALPGRLPVWPVLEDRVAPASLLRVGSARVPA